MAQAKDKKDDQKNLKALNARYQQRISMVKLGKEAMNNQNFMQAVKQYNTYIKIIADVKEVSEKQLGPQHFNEAEELSEMLLMSHVYWDLCKIYDNAPNLESEFQTCIQKFVEFTSGLKYQVVNAEMLRKFIKRGRLKHKTEFQEAYKKIYISSKKCYVASFCYGEEHPITQELRSIRDQLLEKQAGEIFVRSYYRLSPLLISAVSRLPIPFQNLFRILSHALIKIFLTLFNP